MKNVIKARLPFGPEDPWYEFVEAYKALPQKKGPFGPTKELKAHSGIFKDGVIISSSFTESDEVGRVSFASEDVKLLPNQLKSTLAGWGWILYRQGPDRSVFKKQIDLVDGISTMPMALILILPLLGVEPKQDWGA
jgi:hypothetical protein